MSTEQTALKTSSDLRRSLTLRPYFYILVLAVLALLLPGLLLLPFPLLRVPLGLVGIFLAPGNALLRALFSRDLDLNGIERAALSFGLSIAILPVLVLLLNALPWGIRPWPMAISLSILILIFCGVAAIRRYRMEAAFEEPYDAQITRPNRRRGPNVHTRRRTIIGLMAIIGLCVAVGFVITVPDQKFTEFYILGPEGLVENYPNQVAPGEQIQIPVGITNHEATQARYRVEIHSGGQTLSQVGPFIVKDGETWENKVNFSLPASGENQQVDILLFQEDNITPYRSLRLWIDVR